MFMLLVSLVNRVAGGYMAAVPRTALRPAPSALGLTWSRCMTVSPKESWEKGLSPQGAPGQDVGVDMELVVSTFSA